MIEPPYLALYNVIEPEFRELLDNLGERLSKHAGEIGAGQLAPQIRASNVAFYPEWHWLTGVFYHFGAIANQQAWRFDISAAEAVQYATYGEGGHYAWHTDSGGERSERSLVRKLTVVAPLSSGDDYEGGVLQLMVGPSEGAETQFKIDVSAAQTPGNVIVFPSFLPHRVTPVQEGFRRTLVCWLLGRPFR